MTKYNSHPYWPDIDAYYADNGFGILIVIPVQAFEQRMCALQNLWELEFH